MAQITNLYQRHFPRLDKWIFRLKCLSFDVDMQLEYMTVLNSFLSSGEYGTKDAVIQVKKSFETIYGKSHVTVGISDKIIASLKAGGNYVEIIKQHFSPNIAIGFELSKRASVNKNSINGIYELVKIERAIVKDAFQTLLQPGVMAGLAILANAAVGRYVLPSLEATSNQAAASSFERTVSDALGVIIFDGWAILLIAVLLMITGYRHAQKNLTGPIRQTLDHIWPFSNYRVIWGIRIMKLLGMLKKAGVSDIEALSMIGNYGSAYVKSHIDKMIYDTKRGAGKKEFGVGLLSRIQLVRLSASRTMSDTKFTETLLWAANESIQDIKLQNKGAIKLCSYLLYIIFLFIGGLGVGAVVKSGFGIVSMSY